MVEITRSTNYKNCWVYITWCGDTLVCHDFLFWGYWQQEGLAIDSFLYYMNKEGDQLKYEMEYPRDFIGPVLSSAWFEGPGLADYRARYNDWRKPS